MPAIDAPARPRRLALPALWFVVILGLSSIPASGFEGLRLPVDLSYVVHAIEYGVLGAALAWALEGVAARLPVSVLVGAAAGALDELWQSAVPGRDASVLDWAVDVAAVAVAGALLVRWQRTDAERA